MLMINHMLSNDLRGRNVNHVFWPAIKSLYGNNIRRSSRVGSTLEWYGVWNTTYTHPEERVLFDATRNCHPFFHLMESLWMLAGRRDVEYVAQFVKRMREFSDDGRVFNGAYGYRWRSAFDFDQINHAITALKNDPNSRRVYVGMWNPFEDMEAKSKDIPCNVGIHFYVRDERLTMTVFNRSNDLIWGAYGANVVHMSMLQEYVASCVGLPVGGYSQISSSMHIYVDRPDTKKILEESRKKGYFIDDPYESGLVKPFPMVNTSKKNWDRELMLFMEAPMANGFDDPFFSRVAKPMYMAWAHQKISQNSHRFDEARDILYQCAASDWRKAALDWITRKEESKK